MQWSPSQIWVIPRYILHHLQLKLPANRPEQASTSIRQLRGRLLQCRVSAPRSVDGRNLIPGWAAGQHIGDRRTGVTTQTRITTATTSLREVGISINSCSQCIGGGIPKISASEKGWQNSEPIPGQKAKPRAMPPLPPLWRT